MPTRGCRSEHHGGPKSPHHSHTAVAFLVPADFFTLVISCCGLLANMALGSNQGSKQDRGRLSHFALPATVTPGGTDLPALAAN